MSRTVIGALVAALIAVLTGTAYFVTTSSLEADIRDDVTNRVAKAQELLIQNTSLEMLRLLKNTEALALVPELAESLDSTEGADIAVIDEVFKSFRGNLSANQAPPDIMAVTDSEGKLLSLWSGATPVNNPVPDSYLSSGKIKYPALEVALKKKQGTSEIWDYEGSGAMKVTVAPVVAPDVGVVGAVLVAYAITAPEAKRQQRLLGAEVAYFYGEAIHSTSFGSAKEQQRTLGKTLFEGGLAQQALSSVNGLGEIKSVSFGGQEYLATTGRLPRYSSKPLDKDYPSPKAGAMVLISVSKELSSIGMVRMSIWLVGIGAIVLALLAMHFSTRRILHPLEEIEIGVNDIINGNLERSFEPVGSDLDGLANALNVMLARLLGRPEPGEEEFDEEGNIIRTGNTIPPPMGGAPAPQDAKQAEAEALAQEPVDAYLRRIHSEFTSAQKANGGAGDVSYDDFVGKLHKNEAKLKQKYGAREVRFKVVVGSDGKVTLKPVPIM